MESLFVSTLVVAIAEIGDKTQLLAIILATRFKKPIPIIMGILVATLANHALAATAGYWVSDFLSGAWFRWAIAISFIAMAAWALIPDKADDEDAPSAGRYGVFLTTTIAFFLVEMGDKTQIATVALGAKFHSIAWVAAGRLSGRGGDQGRAAEVRAHRRGGDLPAAGVVGDRRGFRPIEIASKPELPGECRGPDHKAVWLQVVGAHRLHLGPGIRREGRML
jgi:putative Ca2+/H+ antiporter (TMEM165/GDT1 family)